MVPALYAFQRAAPLLGGKSVLTYYIIYSGFSSGLLGAFFQSSLERIKSQSDYRMLLT